MPEKNGASMIWPPMYHEGRFWAIVAVKLWEKSDPGEKTSATGPSWAISNAGARRAAFRHRQPRKSGSRFAPRFAPNP